MSSSPELGVIFPTKDIGADSNSLKQFGPRTEAIGLDFITAYDHVVGVNESHHDLSEAETSCIFNSETDVHEPLVLFAALAVLTRRTKLITGCVVGPQRSTALIAKQAAEVDILSDGRLELGLSIGWNEAEFNALGADYASRAAKLEKQVPLLRQLWTKEDVVQHGDYDNMNHVNISPLPVQRPIPIWVGGLASRAVERAAIIGDGWLPLGSMDEAMRERMELYYETLREVGTPDAGRIMGRINPWGSTYSEAIKEYQEWIDAKATHIAIGSSKDVFTNSNQYFDDLERFVDYLRIKSPPVNFSLSQIENRPKPERTPSEDPLICVITGTHSSGKSTLINDLEDGKITELGIENPEYDDFGYGVVEDPRSGQRMAFITVPEAARWLANLYDQPDLLADNYSLDFQSLVDAETVFRINSAANLAEQVVQNLVESGKLDQGSDLLRPVIISDRSILDGVVYSNERLPEVNTNIVNGSPRTGFATEWVKSFLDVAVILDHEEVSFESDETRSSDDNLRESIASLIDRSYKAFLPDGATLNLHGSPKQRRNKIASLIATKIATQTVRPSSRPYSEWSSVYL